jgi:hypothetical protein
LATNKGGLKTAFPFGGIMFNIDKTILDSNGKLLFNISEQLGEIICLLKPQEVKEEFTQQPIAKEIHCPKCGITELKGKTLTKQTLSAHIRFCKG